MMVSEDFDEADLSEGEILVIYKFDMAVDES